MDFPLPFAIFAGIVSIMGFFIICIACCVVLKNICYLRNNDLMWRSNDARRAAYMQSEQQALTLHPPPAVTGNERQTQAMQPFLTQNQLAQPTATDQQQPKQEFPAQGHQMQYYPQQQQPMRQVPAQGHQHYSQQQEFQQPPTSPQFQQLPTAPEINNQDLPPTYGECVSYK